jgi:adenosylmethionine-8-amino-7-oxononanoate aminotransferase
MTPSSTATSPLWRPWTAISSQANTLRVVESEGVRVRDADGKWYLDAISGVLNASCGHNNSRLINAAAEQMRTLVHYDPMLASHDPAEALATRLAETLPGQLNETLLLNSGSEAVEAAMKMALQYWQNIGQPRERVISFTVGYHGSTALAQSLSGLPFTASEWNAPFPITHVDMPLPASELRSAAGLALLIARFDEALKSGPPAAAVIVEPLIGLGGCVVLPRGFLKALRSLCDEHGTLLVADEIFTGFGRTGEMFAFEHEDIEPDIVVMSKGISGGYVPLAAVTSTTAIKQSFVDEPIAQGLRYGHTTGGHAVAAAVALTVLDLMDEDALPKNAAVQGARILESLAPLVQTTPSVIDVRGSGLVIAIEADTEVAAAAIADKARSDGVLVRHERGIVRIAPPLIIGDDESTFLADVLVSAAESLRE